MIKKLFAALIIFLNFCHFYAFASDQKVVVIDPFYGGKDLGPISSNNEIYAKDITLSIAKKLGSKLKEKGNYNIIYTRDADKNLSIDERLSIINKSNGDVLICIGINSSKETKASGFEIHYLEMIITSGPKIVDEKQQVDEQQRKIINGIRSAEKDKNTQTRELAKKIHSELRLKLKNKDRGLKPEPLDIFIGSNMLAVLMLPGFITNPKDKKYLSCVSFQDSIADSIVAALEKYFNKDK